MQTQFKRQRPIIYDRRAEYKKKLLLLGGAVQ